MSNPVWIIDDDRSIRWVFEKALAREGIAVAGDGDGALRVDGTTSDRVGEIAAAAGVVLHELAPQGSSLEQIFLELTSDEEAA